MDVKQAVKAELDKMAAAGEKIPALRVLRARIGRGSLTTISEAVKEWEGEQIAAPLPLPNDLSQDEQRVICSAVWRAVMPMLQDRLAMAQNAANERVKLEQKYSVQLREETEATLAESASRVVELKKLETQVAEQQKLLEQASRNVELTEKENRELRNTLSAVILERDSARRDIAALKAEIDTLNRLLPLLNDGEAKATKKTEKVTRISRTRVTK